MRLHRWRQERGPFQEFRRRLVLEPCVFFTFKALDGPWPRDVYPQPYFMMTDWKTLQPDSDEFRSEEPSCQYFQQRGSFFGIVGWDRDSSFRFVSESEGTTIHDYICYRLINPWLQIIHDYRFFVNVFELFVDQAKLSIRQEPDDFDDIQGSEASLNELMQSMKLQENAGSKCYRIAGLITDLIRVIISTPLGDDKKELASILTAMRRFQMK